MLAHGIAENHVPVQIDLRETRIMKCAWPIWMRVSISIGFCTHAAIAAEVTWSSEMIQPTRRALIPARMVVG